MNHTKQIVYCSNEYCAESFEINFIESFLHSITGLTYKCNNCSNRRKIFFYNTIEYILVFLIIFILSIIFLMMYMVPIY